MEPFRTIIVNILAGLHTSFYQDGERKGAFEHLSDAKFKEIVTPVLDLEVTASVDKLCVFSHRRKNGHNLFKICVELDSDFGVFVSYVRDDILKLGINDKYSHHVTMLEINKIVPELTIVKNSFEIEDCQRFGGSNFSLQTSTSCYELNVLFYYKDVIIIVIIHMNIDPRVSPIFMLANSKVYNSWTKENHDLIIKLDFIAKKLK